MSYTYDAAGRRASKTVGGVTTNYLHDGVNVVQQMGAQVQDRRAKMIGATHSFWYVKGSSREQYVISGGPTGNCSEVDALINAATNWPENTIPYNWRGPNSNSAAHNLGTAGDFNPTAPPGSVGWNTPIP